MNQETVIKVDNVSMRFKLPTEKITSMKHFLIKKMKKEIEYVDFFALDDVSFEIKRGDVIGLIGLNGAGKSTILKLIAGVMKPTKGKLFVDGKIAPLLELGAGFDGDLTGIENIYLNGLMLGYKKGFIQEKLEDIIEFSELRKFINTPLKNYSSGMKARLGFAIATIVEPDILIVDEALAVGDHKFRKKCEQRIKKMIEGDTTVILVSHNLSQIEGMCNKVIWLESGKIKTMGETREICELYKNN